METEEISKPNPYGANGTTSDPREQICWDLYIKSLVGNKGNAYQSAIDAGYEESSAIKITTRDWFVARLQKLKRKDMLSKAERNLDNMLDENYKSYEGKIIPEVAKIVVDVSKTIVKTLGKDKGYTEKTETDLTSGGQPLQVIIPQAVAETFKIDANTNQETRGSNTEQKQI